MEPPRTRSCIGRRSAIACPTATPTLPSFELVVERVHPEIRLSGSETVDKVVRRKAAFQLEHLLSLPGGIVWSPHPGASIEYLGTVIDVTQISEPRRNERKSPRFLLEGGRTYLCHGTTNDVEGMMSGVLGGDAGVIFGSDLRAGRRIPRIRRDMSPWRRARHPGAFALVRSLR